MDRLIGEISGNGNKQLLIAIGGMHGNEPAGILAIERLLEILSHPSKTIRGKFLGLRGNLEALKLKRRFLHSDLNRIWTARDLAYPESDDFSADQHPDHAELVQLSKIIDRELAKGYDEVVVIDLHTTSANSGVFIACKNDSKHRGLVSRLHVPVIVNLAEELHGTAMQYFWQKGCTAFAFEGGNHFNPESVNKMESALWLTLESMGMINRRTFGNVDFHDQRLKNSTEGLPHFCELVYHHLLSPI